MASKKYTLILGLLGLIQTASFAQKNDADYSWALDSSKISTKAMPQHNEFMNNTYPYPARPRNMWELGFSGGAGYMIAEQPSKIGVAGGVSLRKALGHVVSLRAGWTGSFIDGPKDIFFRPPSVAHYYKTAEHMLSLDALFSMNSMSHYRGNPKVDWYALGGYSLLMTQVRVKTQDGSYHVYHNESQRQLITTLFGTAVHSNVQGLDSKSQWLMHAIDFGGGMAFKVSDRINFGIEQKFVFTPTDDLDAYEAGKSNDILSYTTLRLNLNLGSASSHVQPLWWVNPNNYIYNEVNAPKHMKMPPVVLPDADGDGVTDQFDQEPNTPAGCPVDTHGVSKDTDGDGVPDCKDKELLTPQSCFPVDADGVGKCPEPPCCDSLRNMQPQAAACTLGSLPSVTFKGNSVSVSKDAQTMLASAASQINSNPTCKVKVIGYGASDKRAQQLSWDRVNAVINYLVTKQGISEDRFIFTYGQSGNANTVDLQGTTEEGPNTVPAPHPNLQRSK
ncbi:MAG: OmpA family protein [Chitinophagaceae bacterium]